MVTRIIAAGLLALGAFAAVPALADAAPMHAAPMQADYRNHDGRHDWNNHGRGGMAWRWQRQGLSPAEIQWSLRRQGFHAVRGISRRGPVYQAWALDFRGVPVRVVVSARSGAVIGVQRSRG